MATVVLHGGDFGGEVVEVEPVAGLLIERETETHHFTYELRADREAGWVGVCVWAGYIDQYKAPQP